MPFAHALFKLAFVPLSLLALGSTPPSSAAELTTNASRHAGAPAWLKRSLVEKVEDRISRALEWDIRRVSVTWYDDAQAFARAHGIRGDGAASIAAVTRRADLSVHLGPKVSDGPTFERIYGHELVHVILAQKYKKAIPAWLEEGLANFTAAHQPPDYAWLARQPARPIRSLGHPFAGGEASAPDPLAKRATLAEPSAKYHYAASTAAMQFIASRCNVADLLQLSVGKSLETYLANTCGITDLDAAFTKFVQTRAKLKSGS